MNSKVYFDQVIDNKRFQITNSFVSYEAIIPIKAISYIGIEKKKRYSYWGVFVFFIIAVTTFVLQSLIPDFYPWENGPNPLGVVFTIAAIVDFIVTILVNQRRFLCIYSHSNKSITVQLNWLEKSKQLEPIKNAITQAVEDNHLTQNNSYHPL